MMSEGGIRTKSGRDQEEKREGSGGTEGGGSGRREGGTGRNRGRGQGGR